MTLLNHVVEPLLSAALNTLWQAVLLVMLVWVVLRLIPRMNASTRHAVWWASLAAILLLPAASSLGRARRAAPADAHFTTAPSRPGNPSPRVDFHRDGAVPVRVRAEWLPAVALGAWLILALVQFIRILRSYAYVRGVRWRSRPAASEMQKVFAARLAQCRIGQPVRLLISNEIVSPMATGFLRPAVILPASLGGAFEEAEIGYVLLHELAHLARGDNWTNLAARFAAAFAGLHPVAVWILRRIERERELACDDWVVSFTGQARPYAQSLARLFEVCAARRRVLLATGMAERGSQLGQRIERLLRGREFSPRTSLFRVLVCGAFALVLAVLGTLAPRWIAFARDAQPAAPAQTAIRRTPAVPVKTPRQPQTRMDSPAPAPDGLMATLAATGYGDLSVDEIISVKSAGVSPAFLRGMSRSGWGKPSIKELIQLWQNGVSAEYAAEMGEAGYRDLTLADVLRLHAHGVQAAYMEHVHSLGFGPFSAQESVDLAAHGVSQETLRALKEAGLTGASVREIIDANNSGLRQADVEAAKRFNSRLTLEQILKLKRGGVL